MIGWPVFIFAPVSLRTSAPCDWLFHATHLSLWADKDNLFVPSAIHFEIVYLRPDRPAVVPCRVTDPQAKVSLHREVPPEELTANGTLVAYEPNKGFILQNPSPEHQGVFYCKAVTKGTPQISTKYQLLYVEGEDAAIAQHFSAVINTVTYGDAAPSAGPVTISLYILRSNIVLVILLIKSAKNRHERRFHHH